MRLTQPVEAPRKSGGPCFWHKTAAPLICSTSGEVSVGEAWSLLGSITHGQHWYLLKVFFRTYAEDFSQCKSEILLSVSLT